jgi:dTDP-4-dehydrorhamnose 3,5-epimerase
MFTFKASKIKGCFEIQPRVIGDIRGKFVKVFHAAEFSKHGLETSYVEDFFSVSNKGVIRGLHFQLPPYDHVKIVYCQQGEAMDVVVDLRLGSPTYGEFEIFKLSGEKANGIYIPAGLAHGFCATSESALMIYKVSSVYSPEYDSGVRWDSMDIPWPIVNPTLSSRDLKFPEFTDFISPFIYEGTNGK